VGPGGGKDKHNYPRPQKRWKMMKITENLKGVQDMKNLQIELIVAQTQKKDRQAQMEPLQELAVEVIA
jgi:ribosomal protein S2